MKHILILTDFSPQSDNAVDVGFKLASQLDASITIFHAMISGEVITFQLDQLDEIDFLGLGTNISQNYFKKWALIAKNQNIKANYITSAGEDLLSEIDLMVEKSNADMVIMGNKGTGLSKNVTGSTAEYIVQKTEIPVLLINEPVEKVELSQIVFASEFNQDEVLKFKNAIKLLQPSKQAVFHLLTIDTGSYFTQPGALMTESLRDFEVIVAPYKVVKHIYSAVQVKTGIQEFYEEIQADLLIMCNRNKSKLESFFTGHISTDILQQMKLPVLIM